jgi:ATP-dependent DNA ligase
LFDAVSLPSAAPFPSLDLPIVPPLAPMEARLADALPAGGQWQFHFHYSAGHASAFSRAERERLTRIVEPLVATSSFTGDAPGGPSRWARGRSMEWTPVRPVLVVEVEWRHASGGRFRHGVRLMRFRPDKAPEQCTFEQIERPEAGGPAAAPPEA